jgi:hypothetical protein
MDLSGASYEQLLPPPREQYSMTLLRIISGLPYLVTTPARQATRHLLLNHS